MCEDCIAKNVGIGNIKAAPLDRMDEVSENLHRC